MSRIKISDEKRQRTAQACDFCKRRKQKCNGVRPCATCFRKNVNCTYSAGNPNRPPAKASGSSPAKRRHAGISSDSGATSTSVASSTRGAIAAAAVSTTESSPRPSTSSKAERGPKPRSSSRRKNAPFGLERTVSLSSQPRHHHHHHSLPRISSRPATTASNGQSLEDHTRTSPASGQDEEAVLEHTDRLLRDQTGRLLYIGDSATLSYLHLLRRMVESISGPSSFTTDPSKGNIVETVVDLPPQIRPPIMLADRQTANVLVESFFTNTSGLVEIFDRHEFFREMDACYDYPLSVNSRFLCLLFLTFAIGLVMATHDPGTNEFAIVQRLNSQPFDQAELFFRSAKSLCDPPSVLEDADFWSVQALSLISIYMLAVSKRNAAFVYHGMAVRSAIALGLHREEAMDHFKDCELNARRNIWKSLYVLDRFIAASLGRPSAINEDECTQAALTGAFEPHLSPILEGNHATGSYKNPAFKATKTHELGVNTTVRSCRIIGNILKKLYAPGRVSIQATQDIVLQCQAWTKGLHKCLRWHRRPSTSSSADAGRTKTPPRAESIAVLHVNLVYCHSIILLTRPFFLFLIRADRPGSNRVMPALRSRTEMFSEVCVAASYHSITMIQEALDSKYLPRRNPFVMYFLFTAALLVMSNEFVALFHHPAYDTYATQAISIMEYFSEADAQGTRLLWILRELQKDVVAQPKRRALPSSDTPVNIAPRRFLFKYPAYFLDGSNNPIALFFDRDKFEFTASSSSSRPRLVDAASRLASGNHGDRVPDTLGAGRAQAVYGPLQNTESDHGSTRIYQKPGTAHLPSATAYSQNSQHGGNLIGMPSSETTSPPAQATSSLQSRHLPRLQHPPHLHAQSQPTIGYVGSSPTLHPPVLPPPFPAQPQNVSFSPGHAGGGSGGGGNLGESMAFGGAYGGQAGFAGVLGGNAPGSVSGYFHQMSRSKSGDMDGSDSISTDNDGFGLAGLWHWSDSVASLASTETASMTASSVPAVGATSLVSAASDNMGSSLSKQQGPIPLSPLPPVYSPYNMALSAVGSGMTTPHSGSLMAAPMNVPLYPTADFG